MVQTATDNRTYPDSVYKAIDEDLTTEIVEKIASTKPNWADFDHTDIGAFDWDDQGRMLVSWCRRLAEDVSLCQDAYYDRDGNLMETGDFYPLVWLFGDATYPKPGVPSLTADDLRAKAAELLEAADEFDIATEPDARILYWPYIPSVTEAVIYHRVTDGVDLGEIAIPFNRANPEHLGQKLAHKLASMQPGEVYDHIFQFSKEDPKEHHVDTYIGTFKVKSRLSGQRALLVPTEAGK